MPTRPHRPLRLAACFLLLALAACDAAPLVQRPQLTPATADQSPSAAPPTPAPAQTAATALSAGLALRDAADYQAAAAAFDAALRAEPDGGDAPLARLYLAESLGAQGRWSEAGAALDLLLAAAPAGDVGARALFLRARAHEETGAWAEAAAAYGRYQALGTPIAHYALLRQAAQQRALGQHAEAAAGYESAARGELPATVRAGAYEQAIAARRALGQVDEALVLYRELLDFAQQPAYRADILLAAAALAGEQGQAGQAREWRAAAIAEAPATAAALESLALLQADPEAAVDPAAAAAVLLAHERWDEAIPQLDAAASQASGADQAELRRRRALALRSLGDFPGALAELEAIGTADPDGEVGRQAQLDWVQTVGQSGDVPRAIAGYREYAAAYPDDPRAPVALARAVVLLEGQGDAEGAAQQRLELGRRYPAAEGADRALFLAGMHFHAGGRRDEALGAWRALAEQSSGSVAAQAAYWQAQATEAEGQRGDLLDAARDAAPESYYAVRVGELFGDATRGAAWLGAPVTPDEWRAAEAWLSGWSGQPVYHVAERGYPAEVAQEPAVLRAAALADVGLVSESVGELRGPLEAWRDDPGKLYLLARLAHERGVHYVALVAAERVAALGPGGEPAALRRLIYPAPYRAIVVREARERGLDPLALYALLRQESHFNPAATSWVGARGLAQVMPETAQGIAQALGVEGFQPADLYRPEVSVRFGAFYLRRQLDNTGDSLPGALAAYNGGLSNAWRWAGGETVADQDMFVEQIDFTETRNYVKLVYGYYGAYRAIYRDEG